MKNTIMPLARVLLASLLILISVRDAKASHAMGADVTYHCLGNNQYEVTFSFYRDCAGIPAPATMDLNISNSCGFNVPPVTLTPNASSPTLITPLCPSATSTCNGGTFTGIQEWIYTGIVTLPGPCADWTFSHSENARNAAISTITGGGSDDLFVYTTLNNMNGICDDSPIFSNRPVPFACVGQRFCFNHGAFDAQGDSLSYQLITPRNGPTAGDTVTYLTGYSAQQPVLSSPPMTFNPLTGDFCMNPTQQDVTVLAVLVNEYRNGVLIGQVERDIQLTVLPCANILPSLTGINGHPGVNGFNATVCAGNPLCFWIASVDPDQAQTTTITWDHSIPGATLTTHPGVHRDTAQFCWTPTSADISNTPYCFTVTVQDDNCPYLGTQVYAYCITVIGVVPDAGPDQTIPCGVTATLTGTATGGDGTYTYLWKPDSVPGSQLPNVGVGTYILSVTSGGCLNTDTVQVLPGLGVPAASFTFSNNCSGLPVQFSDNSTVTGSSLGAWDWDFGDNSPHDNTQNPTHQFPANGTYDVILTVTTVNNCGATISIPVTINTNVPTAQFTAPNVCDGASMSFTDQSIGGPLNNWLWDFNDPNSGSNTDNNQNPSHTFSTSGQYNVTLTVTNTDGCTNQIQQNVTVTANPVINVVNAGMCEGAQATLDGPAGYSSYLWDNSQNTQSITVSPPVTTNYTLTVTDASGCVGSYTATVSVDPVPVPDAGAPQTICEGTSANLSGTGGNIYEWNPGNINSQNVSVSPNVTTVYVLTVSTNAGCSATDVVTITVNPMPTANAGDDLGICKGESTTINAVTGAANVIWTPGNFVTPSITVTPPVTTTYTLFVSDAIGCSGADTITITVNPLPVAQFSNSGPVCANNSIDFTDNSNIPSGSVSGWSWDFGNGQFANTQNPSVLYSSDGTFDVKLTVTSDAGCKDSILRTAIVNPLPVADAGTDQSICPGFNATLTGNGGIDFLWSPGGMVTSSITVSPGSTTTYTLHVIDPNGCENTDQADVVVNPVPIANAGVDQSICLGETTALFASGGDFYVWSPGNINSQGYTITPPATGVYSVLVTNQYGCQSTDQVAVQVNPIPTAVFASSGAICEDNPVSFIDQSNVAAGSIIAWNWNFGNNVSSVSQNPTIPFYNPGNFNVTLVVYSDNGCSDTMQMVQSIWARPHASFTHTDVCDGNPIAFSNTSSITDATPLNYSWNIGENVTSSNANLTHQYSGYGAYQASLVVTSQNGCIDSTTSLVNVFSLPSAAFHVDYSCEDDPAVFLDQSFIPQGAVSYWYWTFGDSDASSDSDPSHVYADPGDYNIHLLITSDHGCQDSTDGAIRVVPRPLVDFETENACLGYPVDLTELTEAVTGPIVNYDWKFGDGTTSNDQNPEHVYTSSGWFEVTLTATTDSGCATTLVRPNALQIYPSPDAEFVSNSTEANDVFPLVNFVNQTVTSGFFYWNFGDGDTSTEYSPTHLYATVGSYDVQLITIDQNGCIDSTVVRVEIRPGSNVYIPNAFTPNGDLKNDFFQIYSHNITDMVVQIYDRWGIKIIEWKDVKGVWDGKVNGDPAQSDTYVYRVSTVDVNKKKEVFIGHVSLVR